MTETGCPDTHTTDEDNVSTTRAWTRICVLRGYIHTHISKDVEDVLALGRPGGRQQEEEEGGQSHVFSEDPRPERLKKAEGVEEDLSPVFSATVTKSCTLSNFYRSEQRLEPECSPSL